VAVKSASGAWRKPNREIIILGVFAVFQVLHLGERLHWKHLAGFVCLVGAAFFMFRG